MFLGVYVSFLSAGYLGVRQRHRRGKGPETIYSYIGGRSSSANSKATWVPTNSSGNSWISSSIGTSQPGTGMGTATSFSSTSNSSPELLPASTAVSSSSTTIGLAAVCSKPKIISLIASILSSIVLILFC